MGILPRKLSLGVSKTLLLVLPLQHKVRSRKLHLEYVCLVLFSSSEKTFTRKPDPPLEEEVYDNDDPRWAPREKLRRPLYFDRESFIFGESLGFPKCRPIRNRQSTREYMTFLRKRDSRC